METTVNPKKRGNPTWLPATKEDSILMAARVPLPVAEEIERYCQAAALTKTTVIIEALAAYLSDK